MDSYVNIPGSVSWKDPVSFLGSLPANGNNIGDARVVKATTTAYIWNGTTWTAIGGSSNGINNGGNSFGSDITIGTTDAFNTIIEAASTPLINAGSTGIVDFPNSGTGDIDIPTYTLASYQSTYTNNATTTSETTASLLTHTTTNDTRIWTAVVQARRIGTNDSAGFVINSLIADKNGTVTVQSITSNTVCDPSASQWTCAIVATDVSTVQLQITGQSSATINWSGTVTIT